MEESWETGERDDKARRREESCYSENNGIGEVREIGKKLIFYASDRVFKYCFDTLKTIAYFLFRPILEEQALLREKLKNMPSWKKEKDAVQKRKMQPMVSEVQCTIVSTGYNPACLKRNRKTNIACIGLLFITDTILQFLRALYNISWLFYLRHHFAICF